MPFIVKLLFIIFSSYQNLPVTLPLAHVPSPRPNVSLMTCDCGPSCLILPRSISNDFLFGRNPASSTRRTSCFPSAGIPSRKMNGRTGPKLTLRRNFPVSNLCRNGNCGDPLMFEVRCPSDVWLVLLKLGLGAASLAAHESAIHAAKRWAVDRT